MTLFDRDIAPQTYAAIRFGMGFPLRAAPTEPGPMLARLAGPDETLAKHPMLDFQSAVNLTVGIRSARKSGMMDPKLALKQARAEQNRALFRTLRDEFIRAVETEDPFRERLMAFWANHFTARHKSFVLRAGHAGYAADAIRPHLAGRFPDMLRSVAQHPFMLHYLDQRGSVGPGSEFGVKNGRGLNENFARELIELHTLGAGADYGQADVRQLAELLTGLTADLRRGFRFRADWAEPGAEEILGKRYGGDGAPGLADIDAALEDLALHPATAGHLARKLAAHFVADEPGAGLVAHMASAYLGSKGDLMALYTAMLEHPDAWAGFGGKVKTPMELMLTACRASGLRAEDFTALDDGRLRKMVFRPLMRVGQRYAEPPGPDGWPDRASDWITPHGLAGRLNWIIGLARVMRHLRPDPRRFVTEALGDAAGPALRFAAKAAETREEGVMLILASAEFNRR